MAGKARVHELAKELGVSSKDVLARLNDQGEFVKSASSTVEAPVARRLRESFGGSKPAPAKGPARGPAKSPGNAVDASLDKALDKAVGNGDAASASAKCPAVPYGLASPSRCPWAYARAVEPMSFRFTSPITSSREPSRMGR